MCFEADQVVHAGDVPRGLGLMAAVAALVRECVWRGVEGGNIKRVCVCGAMSVLVRHHMHNAQCISFRLSLLRRRFVALV